MPVRRRRTAPEDRSWVDDAGGGQRRPVRRRPPRVGPGWDTPPTGRGNAAAVRTAAPARPAAGACEHRSSRPAAEEQRPACPALAHHRVLQAANSGTRARAASPDMGSPSWWRATRPSPERGNRAGSSPADRGCRRTSSRPARAQGKVTGSCRTPCRTQPPTGRAMATGHSDRAQAPPRGRRARQCRRPLANLYQKTCGCRAMRRQDAVARPAPQHRPESTNMGRATGTRLCTHARLPGRHPR
jgi:hypothetical protein